MARPKKENPAPSETDGTSRRRNRRQALALGGAAAAAAAVAALGVNGGKKAQAGHGGGVDASALHLGQSNDSGTQGTLLSANLKTLAGGPKEPASTLVLESTATALGCDDRARALIAESAGEAILGITWGAPGEGGLPTGVRGCSGGPPDWGPGTGVAGISGSGFGVEGDSVSGIGVVGHSGSGAGVVGRSDTGIGVYAQAGGDVPAVRAVSAFFGAKGGCGAPPPDSEAGIESDGGVEPNGGLALDVIGKAAFSTAGDGVVPGKAYTATVANPAVTAGSHITVTLTDDPGRASVAWVERQADAGFTVHMSSRPRSAVPFTYLIVEPGV